MSAFVLWVVLAASVASAQPITVRHPASQPAGGPLQNVGTSSPNSFGITRVTLALGAVVSLIFAFKWGARRFMIGGASHGHSRAIQVVSRTIVSPRQQLMLLKVGRRLVLVSNTGAGMSPICEIRDEQEVAELLGQVSADRGESVSKAFSSLFGREEEKFSDDTAGTDDDGQTPDRETDQTPESVAVGATRDELSGLMEKVRLVSKQFRRSSSS